MKYRIFLIVFSFVAAWQGVSAQNVSLPAADTLKLDVQQAEQRFVSQNMSLLAAKYDIEIAQTNILQSRLWYNPNISYSQTLYNEASHKLFDMSTPPNGEWAAQISQLFSVAGKHTNMVKLARLQAKNATLAFQELVRSLKYGMYSDITRIYADQQKIQLYDREAENLKAVMNATQQQVQLGAIAANELVRLRAEFQDVTNNAITIQEDLLDAMADLKVLLHYPARTYLTITQALPSNTQIPDMATVLNTGFNNRSDLRLAENEVAIQNQNLKYQRSLSVPDWAISGVYDKAGGAGYNYSGIGLSTDLPVFNRNQGGIRAARIGIQQAQLNDSLQLSMVQNQVTGAYMKVVTIRQQLDGLDATYVSDLETLMRNALINYNKRYINLLEFLDQIRTYTNARFSLIDLNSDYINAIQNLNYTVGTDLIK